MGQTLLGRGVLEPPLIQGRGDTDSPHLTPGFHPPLSGGDTHEPETISLSCRLGRGGRAVVGEEGVDGKMG